MPHPAFAVDMPCKTGSLRDMQRPRCPCAKRLECNVSCLWILLKAGSCPKSWCYLFILVIASNWRSSQQCRAQLGCSRPDSLERAEKQAVQVVMDRVLWPVSSSLSYSPHDRHRDLCLQRYNFTRRARRARLLSFSLISVNHK